MIELVNNIELTQPQWLWLLPVLFILTWTLHRFCKYQSPASLATGKTNAQHTSIHPLIALLPKSQTLNKTSRWHNTLTALAISLFIFSLSEPVLIGEQLPDPPRERDIMFIVDSSISMTLRDYVLNGERVDRMTLLKGVLDRFIQQLPGERIGIIIFGDAAHTLVPLTRDQSLLRNMLPRIEATMAGRFNNIGEAIALAVKQTQQQLEGQRHRVLIMLTDADKPTGTITPDTAANLAAEAHLPLYTIAIGASSAAAEEQRVTGLIYEPVDVALLKSISESTGARSYQAGDARALEQAINDIAQHETNQRVIEPRFYREPLYLWPLLLAVTLLIISSFVSSTRRAKTKPTHAVERIHP